jgi:hypothetical protein
MRIVCPPKGLPLLVSIRRLSTKTNGTRTKTNVDCAVFETTTTRDEDEWASDDTRNATMTNVNCAVCDATTTISNDTTRNKD